MQVDPKTKRKNWAVLAALVCLILLFYFITIARIAG